MPDGDLIFEVDEVWELNRRIEPGWRDVLASRRNKHFENYLTLCRKKYSIFSCFTTLNFPTMAISQLSMELWEWRMSGWALLIIFIKESRVGKLKGRFMGKRKQVKSGWLNWLTLSASGLSGWQTMETRCPRSSNNWHSWNTLISCPPQPVAASECKMWRIKSPLFFDWDWLTFLEICQTGWIYTSAWIFESES